MSRRIGVLLLLCLFAAGASASPRKHHNQNQQASSKVNRHDPAFRAGFDDGYREGANDSAALSNVYRDESGPVYEQAIDGYTTQYGDRAAYQKLFREGYIQGYKAGWDFNAGQYNPLGGGSGGGSGG